MSFILINHSFVPIVLRNTAPNISHDLTLIIQTIITDLLEERTAAAATAVVPVVVLVAVAVHYITLHYKLFIVAKVKKKLQGPLWRKSHNNVGI